MRKILVMLLCVTLMMSFVACDVSTVISDISDSVVREISDTVISEISELVSGDGVVSNLDSVDSYSNEFDASEHVAFDQQSDDTALISENVAYFRAAMEEYPVYDWLDSHDDDIRNYYIYTRTSKFKEDATVANSMEELLNVFASYDESYPYIRIESDVVIDLSQYSSSDLSPEAGRATTSNSGVLVIGEGVTLTIANTTTSDDKTYSFGALDVILEPGANIIADGGLSISEVLYISEGATVTMNNIAFRAYTVMNYGTLNLNNVSDSYDRLQSIIFYSRAKYIPILPSFFNASSGNINIDNSSLTVYCSGDELYANEAYGQASFYNTYPTQANYGNISVTGDGMVEFKIEVGEASLQMPFIQMGTITVASDSKNYDAGLKFYSVHFQNFGDITINDGENYGASQNALVNESNSLIENYGTFTFNAESGTAIYLNYGNWINYEGAEIIDNTADTVRTINKSGGYYFDNIPVPTENVPGNATRDEFEGIMYAEGFMQ